MNVFFLQFCIFHILLFYGGGRGSNCLFKGNCIFQGGGGGGGSTSFSRESKCLSPMETYSTSISREG